MNYMALVGTIAFVSVVAATILAAPIEAVPPLNTSGDITSQSINVSNVTTSWDLSFLYKDKEAAKEEYQRLNLASDQINQSFRPKFGNLTGTVLHDYIESDENISKSMSVLYAYANAQNSLNVNDEFFQAFIFFFLISISGHPLQELRDDPFLTILVVFHQGVQDNREGDQ